MCTWRNIFLCLMLGACKSALAASGTLLYVPMDDRPVCLDYTVGTMKAAGWDVKTPPREYIAGATKKGEPDKLMDWLEQEGQSSTAIVASADALLYGGLVGSRTHNIPLDIVQLRAERLLALKQTTHKQKIYVFSTIMRSPKASAAPVEPAYYSVWGPKLFKLGALEDKADLQRLHRKERKTLKALRTEIPEAIKADLYGRRKNNIKATEMLLHGVESESFDYMLLGRDDTATFSQAHREARDMDVLVHELPKGRIRFFAGADQLGLVLLQRAASRLQYELPLVKVVYAPGKGGGTIPSYEDNTVAESARQHIFAAGAFPVRKQEKADLILALNTPKTGICLEAGNTSNTSLADKELVSFIDNLTKLVKEGHRVALADVKYGNGADNALVPKLFEKKLAYKLASYGGWNTSGNTLGFALSQGILAPKISQGQHQYLLDQRYLDDWAYQANARMQVYMKLIWPKAWPNSGLKDDKLTIAEKTVSQEIINVAKPIMGNKVTKYKFTLPWQRMFEVEVK